MLLYHLGDEVYIDFCIAVKFGTDIQQMWMDDYIVAENSFVNSKV